MFYEDKQAEPAFSVSPSREGHVSLISVIVSCRGAYYKLEVWYLQIMADYIIRNAPLGSVILDSQNWSNCDIISLVFSQNWNTVNSSVTSFLAPNFDFQTKWITPSIQLPERRAWRLVSLFGREVVEFEHNQQRCKRSERTTDWLVSLQYVLWLFCCHRLLSVRCSPLD